MSKAVSPDPKFVIAFDFDGTLAHYDGYRGHSHVGEPIMPVVRLANELMDMGHTIAIFTARLHPHAGPVKIEQAQKAISEWSKKHLNWSSPWITHEKHPDFKVFIDDRALTVIRNMGKIVSPWTVLCERPKMPTMFEEILLSKEQQVIEEQRAPAILSAGAKTFAERNAIYGDTYLKIGNVFSALFPEGLTVKSPQEWNRLINIVQIIGKMQRYVSAGKSLTGHRDSAHDAMVYSAMLEEITPQEG